MNYETLTENYFEARSKVRELNQTLKEKTTRAGVHLTFEQLHILDQLQDGSKMTSSVTNNIPGCPDTTRLIDRMVHHGLVRRTRPPSNRRVVMLRITDLGRAQLIRAKKVLK